ncbi:MAG: hypothetical protein IPO27_05705 [Bacteroidetes bacterium]|nr:hypothetical protein [Bacteroidota bacterium]
MLFKSITTLDLSDNGLLQTLDVGFNQRKFDLTGPNCLTSATLQANQLSSIDLSQNTGLVYLSANDNPLTSLDVSALTALTQFYAQTSPSLSSLNTQNGNNLNLTAFNATNCPLLTCIQVDSPAYMNTNRSAGEGAGAKI